MAEAAYAPTADLMAMFGGIVAGFSGKPAPKPADFNPYTPKREEAPLRVGVDALKVFLPGKQP